MIFITCAVFQQLWGKNKLFTKKITIIVVQKKSIINQLFINQIFKIMRKFTILLAIIFLGGLQVAFAQTKITGTIVDADNGSTIPGVTVLVKGTTVGTTTDLDGSYELLVPADGNTLVFSFVGMVTQEVEIGGRGVINISMAQSATVLDEVVVTALGISREKKALSYSVQDIKGDELAKAKPLNIVDALSGKIAGVQITSASGAVGASSRITIRGNSSFGNNQPLFVVDGTPISNFASSVSQYGDSDYDGGSDFGNAAMDIDPANIESVSVLKGANAAALYGSRAANGVILITTKKGVKTKKKGIGVSFTTSTTFENVSFLPDYQDEYGQGYYGSEYDFAQYGDELGFDTYEDWASGFAYNYANGNFDGMDESWGPRLDIGLNIPQFDSPILNGVRQATPWVSQPDNISYFFETGITEDNNIALTAGSDNAYARLSLSNQDVKGAIPNTDLTKNTVNFNGNLQFTKKFSANAVVNYVNNKSDNIPGGGYGENNIMQSLGGWFGRQVNMQSLKDNWDTYDENGNPYNWISVYHNNPYFTTNNNTTSRTRNRIYGNFSLKYELADWLNVMARVGTDFFNEDRKHVVADGSIESSHGGSFWQNNRNNSETNADLIFSFDKNITKDITFDGILGANYMNHKYNFLYLAASELTVPNLYTISNVKGNASSSTSNSEYESNSVFASANFSYKHWMYLSLTARNDWSSTLPKDNWSYFYPSIGGSFIFTDAFGLESDILSFGKIRAGWAKVGNATDAYMLNATYGASTDPFSGVAQYFYSKQLPPLGLKPEETATVEFGVELKFLNNRFGIDVTYYDQKTSNQILAVDIAPSSGFSSMLLNAGEIENKGIELLLTGDILKSKKGFNWNMLINFAKNEDKVNELYGDLESYQISSSWGGLTIEARPGEEFGIIRASGYQRNDAGDILIGSDGLPMATDNPMEIGSITPDWTGGVRNSFTYKNFNLSFLVDFRKGGDVFSVTQWFGAYAGIMGFTTDDGCRETGIIADGVLEDGSPNDIVVGGREYYENWYGIKETGIIDGSFIKLREVVFGYDLPQKFMNKIKFIQSANISFFGRNLALLYTDSSNLAHIDPETGFGTSNSGMGLEQFQLPPIRTLGFKLHVTF